jgi:uncharacterized protein (UPF0333 family)
MSRRSSYSLEFMILMLAVLAIGGYFLYSRQNNQAAPAPAVSTAQALYDASAQRVAAGSLSDAYRVARSGAYSPTDRAAAMAAIARDALRTAGVNV